MLHIGNNFDFVHSGDLLGKRREYSRKMKDAGQNLLDLSPFVVHKLTSANFSERNTKFFVWLHNLYSHVLLFVQIKEILRVWL